MVQPTVYVYDPETGEWVTPEELKRRQAERAMIRKAVEERVSALLQGAVISFTLAGTVCGTTVTLAGTGVIAAVGIGVGPAAPGPAVGPGPSAPGPGGGGPGGRGP
jgi:hypothetical protein